MSEESLVGYGREEGASAQMGNYSEYKNIKNAKHLFFGRKEMRFGNGTMKHNGCFWLLAALLLASLGYSETNHMTTGMSDAARTTLDSRRPKKTFLLAEARNVPNADDWKDEFSGKIKLPGGVKLEMVEIKAGEFMMGSPEEEVGRQDDEKLHKVMLTKDFWMGKTEVTNAQYRAVMKIPQNSSDDEYPVTNVTWTEAMEFCRELTRLQREAGRLPKEYEYTLPTEAQWEYACRAGTKTAFNNGKNLKGGILGILRDKSTHDDKDLWDIANYDFRYYKNGIIMHRHSSSIDPVGCLKPNGCWLYDMHGNVSEWCLDWYEHYYHHGLPENPKGPTNGRVRVIRGGSWRNDAEHCRSAARMAQPPNAREEWLGFRIVCVPIQ